MICCHMKSIKDERMPIRKGRVRADVHLMSVIAKADKDSKGNDITHCMLVICIDINGSVPKWIVNIASQNTPTIWFNDAKRACDNFKAGKYHIKPKDVKDWKYGK